MARTLKIDTQILVDTITGYETLMNDMKSARDNIKGGMNKLQENWKGQASDAYFNIKHTDWEKGLNEHIHRINFLREELTEVQKCYEDIQNRFNGLANG